MTNASAVTASARPRRAELRPMPSAAPRENTPRPTSGLIPIRFAAGGPGERTVGNGVGWKGRPRITTKKPTTPATIATIDADHPRV